MSEQIRNRDRQENSTFVQIDHDLVSVEALLKTCYWFSRDFICDVKADDGGHSTVWLRAKTDAGGSLDEARERFTASALDFALRERVNAKTSSVRDFLLAKALSESGVLEDQPEGIFGDPLEETRPDGMFKILSNS
jgi:His-Xaa-Ser system protein HxsD